MLPAMGNRIGGSNDGARPGGPGEGAQLTRGALTTSLRAHSWHFQITNPRAWSV